MKQIVISILNLLLISSMILLVVNGIITSYFFIGFMLVAIVIVEKGHDDYEWY